MKDVPEGYTYTRCDQYSPELFKQLYLDKNGNVNQNCLEYMEAHPKDVYDTSDQIEIFQMVRMREVGSMTTRTGKNTTRRYYQEECSYD